MIYILKSNIFYLKELCPEAMWAGGLNKAALLNRKKAMAV